MMEAQQEQLCQDRVFTHFYQICQIPHGSGNEKALSDHIYSWALQLGLEAKQDSWNNVFIRKKASPGFENAPGVMLQAHLDMVCEKADGIAHDFAKDSIEWVIDGDKLSTGGKTTLGADDGIGVALAMALLEDDTLQHPLIEALFTTMEEEDLSGAEHFDIGSAKSSYLINLDHVNEKEILCGSCGGMQVDIHIPVIAKPIPKEWESYRLTVSGLRGGHSGEDIHRGRGSANTLINRILMELEGCCRFLLGPIRGGSFRLAIPRDAEAIVWFHPEQLHTVLSEIEKLQQSIREELAETADGVMFGLEPAQAEPWGVVPPKVLDAIALCPDGIYQMNELLTGLVDTSDNLGEVYLDQNELHLVIEIRAAHDSSRTYLFQCMTRLANILGGTCQCSNTYPSWEFQAKSSLRELCSKVYREQYGEDPKLLTVHAGLEVGYFCAGKPGMDAVSLGPDCWDFHSPSETLRISSVKRVYRYLSHVLAAIH